ncbi:MAG TPA: nitroreductase/quinone reductase family protein [Acidimicrobiales bacterium]|nr:nitroreductase/quinone reductase family protein [Acidimicrobiales bacterium]
MTTTTTTTSPMHTAQEIPMNTNPAPEPPAAHYKEPDWFTRHIFNKAMSGLTRLGISVWGSRVLEHRGRSTGELHHTPVNLLTIDGTDYLVAPRGETQWVRNVRHADGHLVLILGRRRRLCTAREIAPADAVPVLREYLRRWKFETGMFFEGLTPDSSDDEWAAAAGKHPVFVIAS